MTDDHFPLTTLALETHAGDAAAREELFAKALPRLEQLAEQMLRHHPRVKRWMDSTDVTQNVSIRLMRSLQTTRVENTAGFYRLATSMMRREIIDMARGLYGPEGLGANLDSVLHLPGYGPAPEGVSTDADLDDWTRLHEAVEGLPAEERETFSLVHYHGWPQKDIAELFAITERTVRRRLDDAKDLLKGRLGGG